MPDDRVKRGAKPAPKLAGAVFKGSDGGGTSGGGIRDRSKCALLKREGDKDPKSKTAVFTCAGCGAVLTGFTAWRNHMKKSSSYKKFQVHGAKVYHKRRLSMRPAEENK
mmetsp:Transcript_2085/g.4059  ORF Transcript_2085/g.4059 Transcript_2085/m.4059 type:complete len:109 (+) Transcript_2085:26-352(+)